MNRYKLQNVLPVKKKQDDDRAPDDDCPEIIVRSEGVTSSFSSNPFTVPATVRFRIYAETLSSFLMGLLRGVEYLESKDKLAPEEGAFVGWIEDTKDRVTVRISKEELPSVQKFLKDNLGSPESGIPHLRIRLPFLVILTELTDIIHDLQSSPDLAFFLMKKIVKTEGFIGESPEKDHLTRFLLKFREQEEQIKPPETKSPPEQEDTFWDDSCIIEPPQPPAQPDHLQALVDAPNMGKQSTPGKLEEIAEKQPKLPTKALQELADPQVNKAPPVPDEMGGKEIKTSLKASNQIQDRIQEFSKAENQQRPEKDSDSEEELPVKASILMEMPTEEEEDLPGSLEPGLISESFKKEQLNPFVDELPLETFRRTYPNEMKPKMEDHIVALSQKLKEVLSSFKSYFVKLPNAAKMDIDCLKLKTLRENMSILTPIQFIDLMYNMDDRVFLDNFRLKSVNSASEIRRTLIGKILEGFNKSDTASWGVNAFLEYFRTSKTYEYKSFFNNSESFKVLSETLLNDISSISRNTIFENAAQRYFLPVYACFAFRLLCQRPEECVDSIKSLDRSFNVLALFKNIILWRKYWRLSLSDLSKSTMPRDDDLLKVLRFMGQYLTLSTSNNSELIKKNELENFLYFIAANIRSDPSPKASLNAWLTISKIPIPLTLKRIVIENVLGWFNSFDKNTGIWSKFVSIFSSDQSLFPEEFLNFIDENLFKDMNGVIEGCVRNFDENYTRKLLSDLYDSRESSMFRDLFGRLKQQLRVIHDKYTGLEINMQLGSVMLEHREGFTKTMNLIEKISLKQRSSTEDILQRINRMVSFQKELKDLSSMKLQETEVFDRLIEKQEIDRLFDAVKSQPNALVKDYEALQKFFRINIELKHLMMLFRDSYYKSRLTQSLPQNGTVSLKRIQELSTEVRLNLKNYFLSTFSKIEDYKRLERPLSELKEREELYKKHEVLTGHEIKMLYMNFNVAKIKREFKACTELMKEILSFLRKGAKVTKEEHLDTPAILKTFQQIIEENQDSKMDRLDEHEYQVFEILSEKDSFAKYDNILKLLTHFARLEKGVFADMLVYRDSDSNIKDKLIDELKSLVVYYSPAALKFKNVSEWMVRMYERRELWSLLEPNSAKSLIACSNSITEDQYELKMTNILSNSRICFVYNDNDQEYQIECVYGMKEVNIVEPSELLKAINEKSTKFSYYHFNEILDIKLKLNHFLEKKAHSQKMDAEPIIEESDQRRMNMMESFIELAESIQKISKNLTICKRLGLVINWQTFLANTIDGLQSRPKSSQKDRNLLAEVEKEPLSRIPNDSFLFGDVEKCGKSVKFAQSNLFIEMKVEDSDDNPTSEQNKPTKVYSSKHVTVLSHCVESWRLILRVDPTKIAPQMHWIYKLEGKQKELICKYFLDSNKTEADNQLSSEELKIHVFRILRFISNETKPDKMAELDQFAKKFQTDIKLDKIYLSKDVFEWLQANFINEVAVKPHVPEKPAKIKILGVDKNRKIQGLFYHLVQNEQENQFAYHQIYFCDPFKTIEQIEDFIIRAISDPEQRFYYLVDTHLLTPEKFDELIQVAQKYFNENTKVRNGNLCFMTINENDTGVNNLMSYSSKNRESFEGEVIREVASPKYNLLVGKIRSSVVRSTSSGFGKSHFIRSMSQQTKTRNLEIFFSGDFSPMRMEGRLDILHQAIQAQEIHKSSLHIKIDMMNNMLSMIELLDQALFQICFFNLYPFKGGYLNLKDMCQIHIEIGNTHQRLISDNLSMVSFKKTQDENILENPLFDEKIEYCANQNEESILRQLSLVSYVLRDSSIITRQGFDLIIANKSLCLKKQEMIGSFARFLDKNTRTLRASNMHQINSFVKIVFAQLKSFEEVNEWKYENQSRAVNERARLVMTNLIFEISFEMVWNSSGNIKSIQEDTTKILSERSTKDDQASKRMMTEYQEKIKAIPDWGETKAKNIFFRNQAVDAKFELTSQVPRELTDFFPPQYSESLSLEKIIDNAKTSNKDLDVILLKQLIDILDKWQLNVVGFIKMWKAKQCKERNCIAPDCESMVGEDKKCNAPDCQGIVTEDLKCTAKDCLGKMNEERKCNVTSCKGKGSGEKFCNSKDCPGKGLKCEANRNCKTLDSDTLTLAHIMETKRTFNKKGYVLTQDNYLKMLKIYQFASLQVPIVIMGATGCGKTYMFDFMVNFVLQEDFECVTLNAGYTEQDLERDLLRIVEKCRDNIRKFEMKKIANDSAQRVWVLFDEFNTSALQCLIAEIMTERKCTFTHKIGRIPENLIFVAACNPYRINKQTSKVGIVHRATEEVLSHRVYPIPDSLLNYIWNFGQLKEKDEKLYIRSMFLSDLETRNFPLENIDVIIACQRFIRGLGSDSSVSLRDVSRYCDIYKSYEKIFTEQMDDPMVMTAYLCYFLRLDSAVIRSELDTLLSITVLKRPNGFFMKRFTKLSEEYLQEAASFGTEGNEVVPKNIAQNRPLRENFLAVVTCTMLKIPLMICGKPGTSKTTAINIAEKLFELIVEDDKAINSKYFKEAKGFIPIKYWGSVITTSVQVSEHFEMAAKRAAKTPDKNVQVVFDEIGLAELSPDNPLKVLHPLLEQKDRLIGFIGLSNWTLDLSKMNRMIYVAQPDLDTTDLIDICKLTEKASFEKDADYQRKIGSLCKAYEEFTKGLKNDDLPDFHGSRDFYFTRNLIDNYIEDALRSTKVIGDGSNDEKCHRIDILIESAINRNFSGRRLKGFKRPADWLIEHYYKLEGRENQRETLMSSINPIKLINLNLIDNNARHLMVFIDSSSAIEDIVIEELKRFATDVQKKDPSKFEFLNGIKRREDYVKVLFQIEMMIKEGYTLVLKNMDEIYGCLFDLFNQSYIDNGDTKLCHMFINNQSRKITVHDDFKCIILMEPEDSQSKLIGVEKKQIPPFLNRFEKHLLEFKDLLEPHVIQRLEEEVEHYFPEKDLKTTFKYQKLIHNLSKDLIYSKGLQNNDLVNSKFDEKLTLRKYYSELFTWMGEIDASHNDEEKSEREQDSHELTSLFSGNYIFEKSLTTKEGYKLKEFKERFLRTHLFNSLQDFLTSDQIDFKQTHSIIFTNTQSWKVEPLIAQMYQQKAVTQEMNWITSNEILDKIGSKKESYYKDLVSREGFLLVSFVNRSDWSHIQEVRFNIEKQPFRAAKIIFLAHTTLRDLETNVIGKSSISFATRKWRMYAIDDLLKCDYENLFKLLSDSSYIKALFTNKEEIRLLKMDIAFKRVKDHLIEKDNSLTNVLRVGKLMKLLEENEKFKEFVANISHHTNIMDKMTIKDFITKKLTNFEARLANYVDSRDYLTEVKSNLLASIMDDEFKAFTKYLDSGIVELSGYIDRNCRDRIFDLMMTEISGETNDRDRICKLRNVTWNQQHETGYNIELFHSKYLPEVQKFGLKDETIGVLEDLDSRRFEEEPENKDTIPTKIQSSELDEKGSKFMAKLADILKSEKVRNIDLLRLEESSSHVHENYLLCALLVLEKYVGTFYPNCLEDVTFKLVARMSDFCLKDIESKQDRTFSMKETINIMLVLFETYREEITFIVSQLRTTLMINKDQIVELLGSSFENYRILMHPIFLDNLVKLIFDSKEELQALINNFRLSIEFEGNCDRIPQKELNLLFKRFVLKFLEHWYSLTQSQTDWKRISKKCSTIQLTTPKKQEMAFFFKSLICLLIEEVEPMNSNQFFSANIQMIFEIIEHPVLKDSDKESVMGLYVEYCFKLEHNIDNQIFIIASTIVRSQKVSSPSEKGRIIEREISQFKPLTCCLKSLSVINAVNKDKFDQNLRLLQTHIINGMYQTRRVQLRSTDKLPVRFIERIGNLKRILTGMTENYNNQKSKILSADLIESIVEYKLAIMQMSCKPEWLTLDIKCEIERTLETILTTSPSKDKDFAYLILIRELYRIYISTEQLRENNFNKIAKTIEDLETRLGGYKIISLFDQMEAFTLKVSTERKLDQLIKNQFAERIQILNLALYHRKGIEDVLVAHQFLNSLSTTPMFQSFYKELIPLRNQNANQQMFFCIGALINLMSSVDGTYISENSLGADQCNPLYNFPGEAPLRNAIVYGDGSGYTAMWKCVGCGLFVPLGNCGQIGHAEFKESSGSCQGCRRGIGVGSEQNMIRVTAEEIASITNLKVVTNRKIFNLEPENANKEWMSIIYFDQIQSLDLAHFIQLFQYLLLSCLKALGRCTNIPQTHLNKEIEADIQYLCRHHQKDPRDMWTMVVLIIFELKQQLSASPSAFSNDVQMRTLLKKVYEESTMNFANTIGTYNEALQAKSREVEEKNFPRNFIKATLSDQQLSQMKEKEVVDLMVYLQDRNPVTVIQLRDHLEALKLNDNQQNPSFLLELIDKGRILARMKGILQCLRDFQLEIRKCFSGLNDKNQLKTKTMMEFIQDNRNENMNSDEYDLRNQVPESIEGGFARFSEEWAKIKNLFRSESQHIRFKYECQELNLLELIEKLDKDSQAMMVYILHVAKGGAGNPDMLEIVMASAVGVLVDIQNAFIEQYLSIIDKRKSNKSAISKKNFLKCSDSNFIDLNINAEKYMLERVYREIRDNRSEAIVVDVDYMANFLADRLFRNNPAEIYLTSTVSFSIPDCKQKLQTIFSKHKIKEQDIFIELQKCKLVLTKDKMSLHGSDLRSALMHLVVILNDEEDMVVDGETKLRDVMKAVEGIFSKTVEELLGSFMIRDLKTLDIYCNSFLFKSPSRSIDMDRQGRDTPPKTKEADREFNEAVLIFLKYEHQYHQNSKDDEKLKKAKEESKITDVITFDTTVEPIKEKKVDALLKYKGDDQNLSVSEFQFKDLLRVIKLLEA